MTSPELPKYIDHTLLKADASAADIQRLCVEARNHRFYAVCINPYWVSVAAELLKGSDVAVCTVVGFPLGATTSQAKAFEAREAIAAGASEIDMVMNVGEAKAGNWAEVQKDIRAVVEASGQVPVKVIIETGLLHESEKRAACQVAVNAGARFVKTSTGFGPGGATVEDIKLMRDTVGSRALVKASGGIRDLAAMKAMIDAGADRIGTSQGVAIMNGLAAKPGGY